MLQDILYGLRLLRRSPGFTLASLVMLAVGIGANTAIYSVLQAVWIDAVPFPDPAGLVRIYSANESWSRMAVSDEDFAAWQAQTSVFATLGAAGPAGGSLRGENFELEPRWASPRLFVTLAAPMRVGRPLLESDSHPNAPLVAVLSFEAWQRWFLGDPSIAGRRLDSPAGPVELVGVTPPGFKVAQYQPPAWVAQRLTVPTTSGGRALEVIGRLGPGSTLAEARTEMTTIAARTAADHPAGNAYPGATLVPLRDELAGAGIGNSLWLLFAAAGIVLLIACANIASLSVARASIRARELAIRAALGASRARMVRQIFCESALIAAAGAAAALLLTHWTMDAIVVAMPRLRVPSNRGAIRDSATLPPPVRARSAASASGAVCVFGSSGSPV